MFRSCVRIAALILILTASQSGSPQTNPEKENIELLQLQLDREKWQVESEMRKREIAVKEREQENKDAELKLKQQEQANKDAELKLKQEEQASSKWWNPLVVAIFAAAVAALGNATVTVVNGRLRRELEAKKRDAELALEQNRAESTRILEMIKTGSPDTAAENLKFLLDTGLVTEGTGAAKLRTFLANRTPGTGPALPATERVQFGESFSPELQRSVQKKIDEYRDYLKTLGSRVPEGTIKITPSPKLEASYWMEQNEILIAPELISDDYAILRQYTHHILFATNPRPWDWASWKVVAITSGLAGYLPCSFLGQSRAGHQSAKLFAKGWPSSEIAQRGYVMDMANDYKFAHDDGSPLKTEPHAAELAWSGAFWELRKMLGCGSTVPKCEAADKILLLSWAELGDVDVREDETIDQLFAQSIVRKIAGDRDDRRKLQARSIFERRGLKLS